MSTVFQKIREASFKDGKEIGYKEGKDVGYKDGKEAVALNCLKKGINVYLVQEVTGLPLDRIQAMQAACHC